MTNIVKRIEAFIQDYVTLSDARYALPLALWTVGTYCFSKFDAFPYLTITSATKRSGKTRLSEMISFCCSNPRNIAAMTPYTIFRMIESKEPPTLVCDEAEALSSEAAGSMRAILNVGYRRGQTVPRGDTSGGIKEYSTYCPKVFVLIGDVNDTLRDRCIVMQMVRAEPRKRFTYDAARSEGQQLRELIQAAIADNAGNIEHAFLNHKGLEFLQDREEEIWTSIFCIAQVFCKDRVEELRMIATDMATEKTQDMRRYTSLRDAEEAATDDEYAKRLLSDLYALLMVNGTTIRSETAVERLKQIPTAPWRKYKGNGIDPVSMADMLSRFEVKPERIAIGRGRGNQKFYRGYKRKSVEAALLKFGK